LFSYLYVISKQNIKQLTLIFGEHPTLWQQLKQELKHLKQQMSQGEIKLLALNDLRQQLF
jgi:hypothetical protein